MTGCEPIAWEIVSVERAHIAMEYESHLSNVGQRERRFGTLA
jgi:hypothetical protein